MPALSCYPPAHLRHGPSRARRPCLLPGQAANSYQITARGPTFLICQHLAADGWLALKLPDGTDIVVNNAGFGPTAALSIRAEQLAIIDLNVRIVPSPRFLDLHAVHSHRFGGRRPPGSRRHPTTKAARLASMRSGTSGAQARAYGALPPGEGRQYAARFRTRSRAGPYVRRSHGSNCGTMLLAAQATFLPAHRRAPATLRLAGRPGRPRVTTSCGTPGPNSPRA